MNVDLSNDERNNSRKVRVAMDILKSLGINEVLKPRWHSSEILRVTQSQEKGVLCKVDPVANTILWESLADQIWSPVQKKQIEDEFQKKATAVIPGPGR